jgi:S-adenosylmethionine hydrolase
MRIITLTTDFGQSDPFVGIMKGVILGIAPQAAIVDLCHGIPPQNITAGALALEAALGYFPPGTIHVGVVDPGVGGSRAAVAIETGRAIYVGPDNGLFSLALLQDSMVRAVHLTNPAYHCHPVSATFHGRDIFAPVAAHLANGVPLKEFGEPVEELVSLDLSEPDLVPDALVAHVLHSDRFGNLITDLRADHPLSVRVHNSPLIFVGGATIKGVSRTYSDVPDGLPVAYFGSGGRLEIGICNGSASEVYGVTPGGTILIWLEQK